MATLDPKLLTQGWLHAHEEDAGGFCVFRPSGTPLAPSRGRSGFKFYADGRVDVTGPGADDRRITTQGTYTLSPDGKLTVKLPGKAEEVMQVHSLDPDRLVVKR
ncbi:hypothetical protein [Burkholderia stagnalis]|uniref:hypothetical protein n=1 Tax=Burkholderia stagnalis TaxID=1503054 RepID=UPI000B13B9B3|nr:hypothetical protein [Burkholderia stagnalis]MDY7805348.1 hypothetical protein [Burkholderia stagnalis]